MNSIELKTFVEGEEDWWFDDCLNQKNKRRSR